MALRSSHRDQSLSDAGAVAAEILRLSTFGELTLFVGSFVSTRPPASLPMANDLKDAIFAGLWHGARDHLSPALKGWSPTLLRRSDWSEVPLEMLVERALTTTGISADRLLAFIGEAPPNYNHAVLAAMLDQRLARIITTNFDELIEAKRSLPGDRHDLSKPHGTFSDPAQMTIRMNQVGRRIVSLGMRRALAWDLRGRDVCFVGYSGRDLDIRPIFKSEAIRSVLWITRPPAPEESAVDLEAAREQVEAMFDGALVRCASVDADEVFDELGQALSVSALRPEEPHPWRREMERVLGTVPWQRRANAIAGVLDLSGCPGLAADVYRVIELSDLPAQTVARATLNRAWMLYLQQTFPEAKTAAQRAVATFRRGGHQDGLADGYQLLALIAERSSSPHSGWGIRYLRKSVDLYSSLSSDAPIGTRLNLGTWLKNRGRFEEAEQIYRQALRDARALGDLDAQMGLHMCMGILRGTERHEALVADDSAAATRLARSARYYLKRSQETAKFLVQTADELRAVTALIGLELDRSLRRRRWKAASELLDEAEQLVLRSPEPDQRWNVASMRGDWLNQMGRSEEAVALLTQAVQNARKVPYVFAALRERGRAFLDLGEPGAAEEDFARAVELAPAGPHRKSASGLLVLARSMSENMFPNPPN